MASPKVFVRLDVPDLLFAVSAFLGGLGCEAVNRKEGMSLRELQSTLPHVSLVLWLNSGASRPQLEDEAVLDAIQKGLPVVCVSLDGRGAFPPALEQKIGFAVEVKALAFLEDDALANIREAVLYYTGVAASPETGVGAASAASKFRRLVIPPFRCFTTTQTLELSDRWNVLLGDNGTGKTTLLRILAGFGGGSTNLYPSLAGRCVATVRAIETGEETDLPFADVSILLAPTCLGYGAWRMPRRAQLQSNGEKGLCRSLLDEEHELPDPGEWLLQADYAGRLSSNTSHRIERAKRLIEEGLLPDVSGISFETQDNEIRVMASTPRGVVPLRDLSYGYRSSLTWVMDLVGQMIDLFPDSEEPFGEPVVILVDEIDLHLHPKWQKQLLQTLDKTFPNAQFIVTAHSPLIVQAAPKANIALLKWQGDGVVIDNNRDYVRKWRVDQILASELFENQPVHAPEVEKTLDRRRELLLKDDKTPEETAELVLLNDEVERIPTAALPEDQEAMDLIREVAKRLKNEGVQQ